MKHEVAKEDAGTAGTGLGMNLRSIVVVAMLMMLLLFAVHCTWVTSHAYSSPSIIIATYSHDGSVSLFYFFPHVSLIFKLGFSLV